MNTREVVKRACSVAVVIVLPCAILFIPGITQTTMPDRLDWPSYGNDAGAMRFVNVDQVNPSNVATLQPAWIFHMNVMSANTSFESQPIVVDGVLYVTSPHGHVFALDAATGAHKWTFNP